MHHNMLKELPESLGRASALETLYLEGNRLHGLPRSFAERDELPTMDVVLTRAPDDGRWIILAGGSARI